MDTKAAFEKWFVGTRSCLADKSKMFETDELGYTNEITWVAYAAYVKGITHGIRIKGKTE